MDSIKQAIDLVKANGGAARQQQLHDSGVVEGGAGKAAPVRLDSAHLEKMRIVAHGGDPISSRFYDVLRTQILQDMDKNGWRFLAVTSPTPNCGKTVTACNLAMSVARLPEREALLVDLDMHKAQMSEYLGLGKRENVLSVLENRCSLGASLVEAQFGPDHITVLPGSSSTSGASEWMASQTMGNMLQAIKRECRAGLIILDLPPLLMGSDVLSILPRMDAVLLVTAVGTTTPNEIKESQKHLRKSNLLRVVVNKTTESHENYYGYGYASS